MKHIKILFGVIVLSLVLLVTTAFIHTKNNSNKKLDLETSVVKAIQNKNAILYALRTTELRKALDLYFQKAIKSGAIVGAGVSIVKEDSIVISAGFGKRNMNVENNVDGETVFRLGSLSKGFGGILAASLASEGTLSFDDNITTYLPDFQFGDKYNTQQIKFSHILSHTSGTPYHSFTNLVEAGVPVASIANRFNEVTPISKPGTQYSYQNAMFALSQEVIQKATGKDVKTLLTNKFFTPLGMSHVTMNHKDLLKEENVAFPHRRAGKGWRKLPLTDKYYNAVLAGGINASSDDMGKWMRFILGYHPDVLQSAAIQQVFNPFITFKNKNKYYQRWEGHLKSSYGFGWRIHEYQTPDAKSIETVWHHGGSVNNYRNEIAIYPESNLGICVLLNGNSRLAKTVIPDLHEIVKSVFSQDKFLSLQNKNYEHQMVNVSLQEY